MENELVEKNMGLVYYIARSFQKSTTGGIEYDDLVQEGMVGLVKAARAFDESKGFLFSTYAGNCIQKEILAYMKRQRKHKRSISINQDIRGTDGVPMEEILGYSQKEYENVWKRDLLERCMGDRAFILRKRVEAERDRKAAGHIPGAGMQDHKKVPGENAKNFRGGAEDYREK